MYADGFTKLSGGYYQTLNVVSSSAVLEDGYVLLGMDGKVNTALGDKVYKDVMVVKSDFSDLLRFTTQTPGVSAEEATAGLTDLGTVWEAPTFAFTAEALPQRLKGNGFALALKTEAWQGDVPVYSADNGNAYTHNELYQGKVVQSITLLDPNGTALKTRSHTYTFERKVVTTGISLDESFVILGSGDMRGLTATLTPAEAEAGITWSSSDEDIVTVDEYGSLTAVRPGSAIITASTDNGLAAYCAVSVYDADTRAFVGNVGLAVGEYLASGSSVPTAQKPVGKYAYLSEVDGTLTLTLHNFSYSGHGSFPDGTMACGAFAGDALNIVVEGTNSIGPLETPLECDTYGIAVTTALIAGNEGDKLTVTGAEYAIYVEQKLNLNADISIGDVEHAIVSDAAATEISFEGGNVDVQADTLVRFVGGGVIFDGTTVTANTAKTAITSTGSGDVTFIDGVVKIAAGENGINLSSGDVVVDGGVISVEAENIGLLLGRDLEVNSGSMVVKSLNTENDDINAALSVTGTIFLDSDIVGLASTSFTGVDAVEFNAAHADTYDYVYLSTDGDTHSHYLQHYEKVEADCQNSGMKEYWVCRICGTFYADSAATETVESLADLVIPAGHDWVDADCLTPKTCDRCGETEGNALGHDWADADCVDPKTCTRCGETEGEALGHDWVDASCVTPKTCARCGETEGEALGHNFEMGKCTVCAEADPDYVPPTLDNVYRIAGADRIATSLGIADQLKEVLGVEKFETIIVASALNFPDALTGSYLAAVKSAPILLTYENAHPKILAYIEDNLASGGTVYILGGESAVSAGFQTALDARLIHVRRLAGDNRFGTNLEILKESGVGTSQKILICTATGFADSLSASAAGLPILLVHGSLNADQKAFLAGTSKDFVIIGGESAVSAAIENELKAMGTVERLGGASRYQTSVLVAQKFVTSPGAIVLAYARNFPDGLCGGPLALALNAPLILTDNYDPSAADTYVEGITSGIVVGGVGLISDEAARAIFDLAANAPIQPK